jgi:hypothetical protein
VRAIGTSTRAESFRGARLRANPESSLPHGVHAELQEALDSGFAAARRPGMTANGSTAQARIAA